MKTSLDPRHVKRQEAMQVLFEWSFRNNKTTNEFASLVIKNLKEIDALIIKAAPEWPIDKIGRVDLAILRLGGYELMQKTEPEKVIIDEAIELAKEFGGENSAKFVNGALGKILKNLS